MMGFQREWRGGWKEAGRGRLRKVGGVWRFGLEGAGNGREGRRGAGRIGRRGEGAEG